MSKASKAVAVIEKASINLSAHDESKIRMIQASLKQEITCLEDVEKKAAYHALRVGLLLAAAQHILPRGGFKNWMEANVTTLKRASCYFYKSLAERFLESKGVSIESMPPADINANASPKFNQMMLDFTADFTLSHLLEKHGIKKGPLTERVLRPIGRELTEDDPEYKAMLQAAKIDEWNKILSEIDAAAIRTQSFIHLPVPMIDAAADLLLQAAKAMRVYVKTR
jgi:hypothetical protein